MKHLKFLYLHRIMLYVLGFREEHNALFEAQRALRLAERMVEEKNYNAARQDLNVARFSLETYTEVGGGGKDKDVEAMIKEVDQISNKIEQNGAIAKIRKSWHRITKKYRTESG